MSAALDLILRLVDEASPGLANVGQNLGGVRQQAEGAAGGFGVLQGATAFVLGGAVNAGLGLIKDGIGSVVGAMVGGNAQFEQYNTQFTVLLGSADAAKERLAALAAFGASTPFELPEVVEANKVLQGFGLQAEDTKDKFGFSAEAIMTIAGDMASGTGTSFSEMALLLGKFSAGATGEAIARMQELGITTRAELEAMGLEFSNSGQLLSPLPEAMGVVLGVMQDKYGGLMEAQSTTFLGMLSNLEDWKSSTLRLLGEPIFEVLKDKLSGVLAFLSSSAVQGAIGAFGASLATGIGVAVDWINGVLLPALAGFLGWLTGPGVADFQAFVAPILGVVLPALQQLGDWVGVVGPLVMGVVGDWVSWKDVLILVGGLIASVVLPALASLVGGILSVAAPIVAAIAAIALLRAAWENNWLGIRDVVMGVIGFVVPLVQDGIAAVRDWWGQNGDAILAKAAEIWEGIKLAVTTAVLVVQTVVQGVLDGIQAYWAGNGEAISGKAAEIWGGIRDLISAALTAIGEVVGGVLGAVQGWWQAHGDSVMAIVGALWSAVQGAFASAGAFVRDLISGVLGAIQGVWQAHGSTVMALVSTAWEVIKGLFSVAAGFVGGVVEALALAIGGDWSGMGAMMRETVDQAWGAIKQIFSDAGGVVLGIVSGLVLDILAVFLETDWGQLGSDVIDGILAGLSAGYQSVIDFIVSLCVAAVDAIKGFFGISSPSRVMAGIFGDVLAGAVVGMGEGEGEVVDRAAVLSRRVAAALAVDAVNMGGVGGVPAGTRSVSGGGDVTIAIDARGALDPRAVEDAAWRAASRALAEAGIRADGVRRVR